MKFSKVALLHLHFLCCRNYERQEKQLRNESWVYRAQTMRPCVAIYMTNNWFRWTAYCHPNTIFFNNFAIRSRYRENSLIDPSLRRHCKIAHYRCDPALWTRESGNTMNWWRRIAVCWSSKRRERLFAFNDWTFRGWSTSLAIFKRTWDCISKTCFSKLSRQNSPIT